MRINLSKKTLAINGGSPIRTVPWYDNFTTGKEEKEAVIRVLDSGYLSLFEGSFKPVYPFSFYGGPEVQSLESMWCDYYKCKHAISVNSATSGLYMAIGALGIGYGDEVIVPSYTMTACATAPLIYGAIPVFADVELETGCIDPKSIEKLITTRTKAILVVHQYGIPADMDAIMKLVFNNNIKIIEDCAQAHGAKYKDKYVGTIGDIGIFSLNVNKTIQTGEGGVCITNNDDLSYRLSLIRNHGEAVVGPAKYEDITNIAGYNYRLTELQAAIAKEQLKKLSYYNQYRIEFVEQLNNSLKDYDVLLTPKGRMECKSTYFIYPLRFLSEIAGIDKDIFVNALNAEGMTFYTNYGLPLYLQPMYQKLHLFKNGYPFKSPENRDCYINYSKGLCPNTERLHYEELILNEHIRLPHKKEDIDGIIAAVEKICET